MLALCACDLKLGSLPKGLVLKSWFQFVELVEGHSETFLDREGTGDIALRERERP